MIFVPRWTCHLLMLLALAVASPATADPAAQPKSQPASQPSARNTAQIGKWFADLADGDTAVREAGRVGLMSLKRADLSTLRKIVEDNRPLQPSQSSMLQDIVTHVYLTEEPYDPDPSGAGFLGIRWGENATDVDDVSGGVTVAKLLPGFAGCSALLEGDLVLSIAERGDEKLTTRQDFINSIQNFKAGATVHFEVMRQGQVLHIPVTLSARPSNIVMAGQVEEFVGRRQLAAEAYWRQYFALLVEGGMS